MAICSKRKYNSFEENSVFIKHKINALCLFVKTKKKSFMESKLPPYRLP